MVQREMESQEIQAGLQDWESYENVAEEDGMTWSIDFRI